MELAKVILAMIVSAILAGAAYFGYQSFIDNSNATKIGSEINIQKAQIQAYRKYNASTNDYNNMDVQALLDSKIATKMPNGEVGIDIDGAVASGTLGCTLTINGTLTKLWNLTGLVDEAGNAPVDGDKLICLQSAKIAYKVSGNGESYTVNVFKSADTKTSMAGLIEQEFIAQKLIGSTVTDTTSDDGAVTVTF